MSKKRDAAFQSTLESIQKSTDTKTLDEAWYLYREARDIANDSLVKFNALLTCIDYRRRALDIIKRDKERLDALPQWQKDQLPKITE